MKNVLLVGGEGYIGSVISKNFANEGFNVLSYDNLIYNHGQSALSKVYLENYEFINGDILDKPRLDKYIKRSDYVVLLAGLVGDPITKKYPDESMLINDIGVKNVVDLCADNKIEKFIFVSTCSNYGLIPDGELADEEFELNPLSLYAKSKVGAEEYILSLKDKAGFNPTVLRFSTAFGLSPRMRFDLTISEFTRDLALGKELLVYDHETWRPYCHVQDFSRLIKIVLDSPIDKTSFQVFNAGGDDNNATKKMIVDMIASKIPKNKIVYKEQGSDPRNYRVNFSKVGTKLGFYPKFSIENGIDELLEALNKEFFTNVDSSRDYYGNYNINLEKFLNK